MASKAAFKRLSKEYLAMQRNPTPFITAKPLESNILEWHYVLRGPPDTPYAGGEYHGKLKFPSDYPYKPPAIQMITPSGRFQTNTNICMSMSNFHPNTWNPAWSVATILNGMLSFMVEDEVTTGSIRTSVADRKALAKKSHLFNLANKQFRQIFPELCTPEPAPISELSNGSAGAQAQQADRQPSGDSTATRRRMATFKSADSAAEQLAAQAQGGGGTDRTVASSKLATAAATAPVPAATDNRPTWFLMPDLPRRWIILLLLLAYVFASKVLSRLLAA
ncbi:Ubiquitin-conjugating enzyme E2 6 [Dipsacomyces acuminosporus]|nr:Ubiquitin-conjugating enzyme E2 6 [Dipsacomyces acuminosporus]